MRLLPCGDAAVLVQLDDLPEVMALAACLRADQLDGVVDVVAAARTVLVTVEPGTDLPPVRSWLARVADDSAHGAARGDVGDGAEGSPAAAGSGGQPVEIPVVYDGPDLDDVAGLTGLTRDEVVAAHTGTPWQVAFGGFAPGFAYLVGGDPRLRVPRRPEPRTGVPAGAVGLAGEFSGVYPRVSPGGWQLLGRTDAVLWDPAADRPALLAPGSTVRFVDVRSGHVPPSSQWPPPTPGREHAPDGPSEDVTAGRYTGPALEVVATGPLTLVQDLGRPGLAALGVGRSGAADRGALRLANRLLANPEGAAGLEVTLGGLAVRARGDLLVAVTGANAPATVEGDPVAHRTVLRLADGQLLRLGVPPTDLRTYVAVRGGVAADEVLGSRSTDMLSGTGPPAPTVGSLLPVGPAPEEFPVTDQAPVRRREDFDAAAPPKSSRFQAVVLRAVAGPRDDWAGDLAALTTTTWAASDRSNRVGLRLDGEPLRHSPSHASDELPSEGVVRGGVQLPPGGQPVLFLADHPVTGGYPVVAVVVDADVDVAAQVRPGQSVRFRLVDL